MKYSILILNNESGEERLCSTGFDWDTNEDDGGGQLFYLTEGNYGCDCNREIEFMRCEGVAFYGGATCGDGRFTIVKAVLENGSEIPIEDAGSTT